MVVEIVGSGIPFNVVFDEHKPNGKSLGSVFIVCFCPAPLQAVSFCARIWHLTTFFLPTKL